MCQGPCSRKQSTVAAENYSEFGIVRVQLFARGLFATGSICLGVWIDYDVVAVALKPVNYARNDFFQLWLVGLGNDGNSRHRSRMVQMNRECSRNSRFPSAPRIGESIESISEPPS